VTVGGTVEEFERGTFVLPKPEEDVWLWLWFATSVFFDDDEENIFADFSNW